jgi:dihydroorotase
MTLDRLFDTAVKPRAELTGHGLAPNAGMIDLHRRAGRAPASVAVDDDEVVIFRGEETLPWSIGEVRP